MSDTKIFKEIAYHVDKYWYCKERLDVMEEQKQILQEKKSRNKKEREATNKKLCAILSRTRRTSKPFKIQTKSKTKTKQKPSAKHSRPKKRQKVSKSECNIDKKMYDGRTNVKVTDEEMKQMGFEKYINFMAFKHDDSGPSTNPYPGCSFITHPFDRTNREGIQRCWQCKTVQNGNEKVGRGKFGFWRNNYNPPQYYYTCRQCFNNKKKHRNNQKIRKCSTQRIFE